MKCCQHKAVNAVAICVWCGRAVCCDCLPASPTARVVCSEPCRDSLEAETKTLRLLLDQSRQSAKASAFYCYLTAGLSAAAAATAWFMLPSPFLICFTGACALVLLAAGFWYGRVAG